LSCFLPEGKADDTPSPALPRTRSKKPTASPLDALELGHPRLLQQQGIASNKLFFKANRNLLLPPANSAGDAAPARLPWDCHPPWIWCWHFRCPFVML